MSLARTRSLRPLGLLTRCALSVASVAALCAFPAAAQLTERVSLSSSGAQGNAHSRLPAVSDDGRYVAFDSDATNFAALEGNSHRDVFVRDRVLGTTTLVSAKAGAPTTTGNQASYQPRISRDGRYVIFYSDAHDLVSPPAPQFGGVIWRKDLVTGALENTSLRSNGGELQPNSSPLDYDLSATGRYVVFISSDPFVVPNDNNGSSDVFVRDMNTGTVSRVSLDSSGAEVVASPKQVAISSDGRWVSFLAIAPTVAPANNTWHLFLKDRQTGLLRALDVDSNGAIGNASPSHAQMARDGSAVVWRNLSTNVSTNPIVLANLTNNTLEDIALNNAGVPANSSFCDWPSISADGRFVAFGTFASNFAATFNGPPVVVRDRVTQTATVVSVSTAGVMGNGSSDNPMLSGDGRFVVFNSDANNLIVGDTNQKLDIYIRDRAASGAFEYCIAQVNSLGCSPHVTAVGVASASAGSGFPITCSSVLNNKQGLLFYGTSGTQITPFLGAYLCLLPPTIRTSVQLSGGSTGGADCSGQFSYDFNLRIASGIDPSLVVGQQVAGQYWSRDPASPSTTNFSDAVSFTIAP